MNTTDVVVVDYGAGNLFSVCRALEHCGAKVQLASDAEAVLAAHRLVLPGVGAFSDGMASLHNLGLADAICGVAKRGAPVLGICLGMQMLLDASEEFGITSGLGLISGQVIPIPPTNIQGLKHKIPHIGWNDMVVSPGWESWDDSPLKFVQPGESVYFVHSFMVEPLDPRHRVADCQYGGRTVLAAIGRENVWGCQFHPEKSGEVGLRVLKGFLTQ